MLPMEKMVPMRKMGVTLTLLRSYWPKSNCRLSTLANSSSEELLRRVSSAGTAHADTNSTAAKITDVSGMKLKRLLRVTQSRALRITAMPLSRKLPHGVSGHFCGGGRQMPVCAVAGGRGPCRKANRASATNIQPASNRVPLPPMSDVRFLIPLSAHHLLIICSISRPMSARNRAPSKLTRRACSSALPTA